MCFYLLKRTFQMFIFRYIFMSFLQDPSEPDKIGMEGVVKFLEDLSLDPTSRLVGAIVTVSM